jgi:hypothetical protein
VKGAVGIECQCVVRRLLSFASCEYIIRILRKAKLLAGGTLRLPFESLLFDSNRDIITWPSIRQYFTVVATPQ